MGIAGTVAKETRDIIILDDNFASVVKVINFYLLFFFLHVIELIQSKLPRVTPAFL